MTDIDIENPYSAPRGKTESIQQYDGNLITPQSLQILKSAGRWSMFLFILHLIAVIFLPFITIALLASKDGFSNGVGSFISFLISIFLVVFFWQYSRACKKMQTMQDLETLARVFNKHTAVLKVWGLAFLLATGFVIISVAVAIFIFANGR
ncbi:MAG: hypothetical protein IJ566_02585 [Cardiobacteriaceae bacterium]|nr:hypothetical protein [Cardiobacteriaceae bacterium]